MIARIFQPAKTAMQSGKGKTGHWVMEFEAEAARRIDPLMGWTSSADTQTSQVHLQFDSKETAIAYAKENSIAWQVIETTRPKPVLKAYSDNFTTNRRKPWTH